MKSTYEKNMKSMKIWKIWWSPSANIHYVKTFTLNSWMPWSYHNDKLLTWEKKEGKEKEKLQQKIGGLVPTTPKLLLHLWQNSLHFSQSLSSSFQGIWPHPDPPLDLLNVRHEQDVCTRPPTTKVSVQHQQDGCTRCTRCTRCLYKATAAANKS